MAKVGEIVESIRSKNAGPFWLTIDIFCSNKQRFRQLCSHLNTQKICNIFDLTTDKIQRYEISDLNVLKFSLPRPNVQGSYDDRDMHGATRAELIHEIELNETKEF